MSARDVLIDKFLNGSPWQDWRRMPLAGDASSRRYARLHSGDDTVILMDAPPGVGATTTQFATLAAYLADCGLTPPEIHAHDPSSGLMIISDLGKDDFAHWLTKNPDDGDVMYHTAIDILLHLKDYDPPTGLTSMSPDIGAEMVDITCTYYAGKPADNLMAEMQRALDRLAPVADTLALRDFHAENLIWRPNQSGLARVGLLDFQDAFVAPEGYDLISLLRDARRDVPPDLRERIIAYYIDQTGHDDRFRATLACLGVQRNLRIIGVFARLAKDMQKTNYLRLIPRVWDNLQADLQHPELANLQSAVNATLPAPTKQVLGRLTA